MQGEKGRRKKSKERTMGQWQFKDTYAFLSVVIGRRIGWAMGNERFNRRYLFVGATDFLLQYHRLKKSIEYTSVAMRTKFHVTHIAFQSKLFYR